jgi:hypothetical protein
VSSSKFITNGKLLKSEEKAMVTGTKCRKQVLCNLKSEPTIQKTKMTSKSDGLFNFFGSEHALE